LSTFGGTRKVKCTRAEQPKNLLPTHQGDSYRPQGSSINAERSRLVNL